MKRKTILCALAALLCVFSLATHAAAVQVECDATYCFSVADFSVRSSKTSSDAASNCLRAQAELMIAPYLKDRFSFRGV